jgi:HK97 gp10 family phage protein
MADYVPNNRSIQLEGFAELEKQLLDMAQGFRYDQTARQTLVKAAKDAMEPVLSMAQSEAHYDTKNTTQIHMRNTLRLDARIPTERDKRSGYVNMTDAAIAVVSVKKSAVSLANEFGTKKMAMRPFLRPSLDAKAEDVLAILKDRLAFIIPAYAAKLSKTIQGPRRK